MYPKVRVRLEPYEEDHNDMQDPDLKAFQSLSLHGSRSPVRDQKNVSFPSTAKVPKCYVPHVPIPRVPVLEDSEVCNLTCDSSGVTCPEKDDNIDENKVNIRVSSIPRPRAVISSPDNDVLIGKKNRIKVERVLASKNRSVLQNRNAPRQVKSSGIPPSTRNSKQPAGTSKLDPLGKKRVAKTASNQKINLGTGRSSSSGT